MEDNFLFLIFVGKYSVRDFVLKVVKEVLAILGRGEGERRNVVCVASPLWKQEPLSIKNPANYDLLGKMVLSGKTADAEARSVLVTSSGAALVVNRGWFGIQPAE